MAVEKTVRQEAITSIVIKYSSLPISKGIKELQDELLSTTSQLSDLINDRYQDFISLPDGLTGMDKVIEDLKQDQVQGDKLMGIGANVTRELQNRLESLDGEISQCKEALKRRRELQKEIKVLSYYLQLDQGRKRVQDLYDSLLSIIDSQSSSLSPTSVDSIVLGLERVARELVYVSGNLNLSSTSSSHSSPVIADISKSVEKLKLGVLGLVKDLLLKTMEKISLRDGSEISADPKNHLAALMRVCQELDSFGMVLAAFTECLIDPFLLEMGILKKSTDLKTCLDTIIEFAREKCKPIFAVSMGTPMGESSFSSASSAGSLLVTGIWDKCMEWLLKEYESSFLVGSSLSLFHENYNHFSRFSEAFETICLEVRQVDLLKSSSVYKEINKKWQLSVYFQLSHNEIVQEFESCFASVPPPGKDLGKQLSTPHSAINRAIDRFWGLEFAIRAISPRIWKSTLIVIHRYINWNTSNIPVSVESAVSSLTIPLVSLTVPPVADTQALALNYSNLLGNMVRIEKVLSEKIPVVLGLDSKSNNVWPVLQSALQDAFEVDSCAGKMKQLLVEALACMAFEVLLASESITSSYRVTGKELPTAPSRFVSTCFTNIKELVQNQCSSIETSDRQSLLQLAAIRTTTLYSALVLKILDSVKKTEESLKKFKAIRKQPTGTSTQNLNNDISGEDKIRTQFALDAVCFGGELSSLGIEISTNPEYQAFQLMIKENTKSQ